MELVSDAVEVLEDFEEGGVGNEILGLEVVGGNWGVEES